MAEQLFWPKFLSVNAWLALTFLNMQVVTVI